MALEVVKEDVRTQDSAMEHLTDKSMITVRWIKSLLSSQVNNLSKFFDHFSDYRTAFGVLHRKYRLKLQSLAEVDLFPVFFVPLWVLKFLSDF